MLRCIHATRLFLLVALALLGAVPSSLRAQSDATIVYLVRHAEQDYDGTNDPLLGAPGEARAALLAEMLRDAGITHVHSTAFNRTRDTAAPIAGVLGLEVLIYDPRDLPAFAEELGSIPGRHLVLGHSNTTPQLVEALGGEPGEPIDEREYDRLYIVTLTEGGPSTVLLRYGDRFER